jgi:DNA-binding winged helix-turn-helix (wHTH) protein
MSATHRLLKFGVFELNLDTEELRKFGTVIKLRPQPFRLLALLASCSGQLVTREEIKEQLWGEETYVDFEHGMNKCVKQIRTALGDDANKPVYIETVPRHGYRLLAPVVAKTVLAPPPRVKESSSGIPADLAEMIRARLAAKRSGANATLQSTATVAPPVEGTQAPANPPLAGPTVADSLVTSMPVPAPNSRWIVLLAAIVVVLLAAALYWYLW